MARKFRLFIEAEIPSHVSTADAKVYAVEALARWGTPLHPADPLHEGLKVVRLGSTHEAYLIKGHERGRTSTSTDSE